MGIFSPSRGDGLSYRLCPWDSSDVLDVSLESAMGGSGQTERIFEVSYSSHSDFRRDSLIRRAMDRPWGAGTGGLWFIEFAFGCRQLGF